MKGGRDLRSTEQYPSGLGLQVRVAYAELHLCFYFYMYICECLIYAQVVGLLQKHLYEPQGSVYMDSEI